MSLSKETIDTMIKGYHAFEQHVLDTFKWYIENLPEDVKEYLKKEDQDFQNAEYDIKHASLNGISIGKNSIGIEMDCRIYGEYCTDYFSLPISLLKDKSSIDKIIEKYRKEIIEVKIARENNIKERKELKKKKRYQKFLELKEEFSDT